MVYYYNTHTRVYIYAAWRTILLYNIYYAVTHAIHIALLYLCVCIYIFTYKYIYARVRAYETLCIYGGLINKSRSPWAGLVQRKKKRRIIRGLSSIGKWIGLPPRIAPAYASYSPATVTHKAGFYFAVIIIISVVGDFFFFFFLTLDGSSGR